MIFGFVAPRSFYISFCQNYSAQTFSAPESRKVYNLVETKGLAFQRFGI